MGARVVEFFGHSPVDPIGQRFASKGVCPFVGMDCIKPRLGACSLQQSEGEPVIICPNRLYADGHSILADVAAQAFGSDCRLTHASEIAALNETGRLSGKEVAVFGKYWGGEISIPQPVSGDEASDVGGFYIDYVLARIDRDGSVLDFTAVEVQTIDTTGSYREQSEAFFKGEVFVDKKGNEFGWSTAGLNWANVSKRILPQIIYKGYVLRRERKCARGLFFVCPSAVLKRIRNRLGTKMLEYPIAAGTVTFQAYDLGEEAPYGESRKLVKGETFTTTVEQVAYAFVSPVNLPEMGVYEAAIQQALNR